MDRNFLYATIALLTVGLGYAYCEKNPDLLNNIKSKEPEWKAPSEEPVKEVPEEKDEPEIAEPTDDTPEPIQEPQYQQFQQQQCPPRMRRQFRMQCEPNGNCNPNCQPYCQPNFCQPNGCCPF